MTYMYIYCVSQKKVYKKIEVSLCLQNTKQISHVSKIKTTKTIHMGFACSADCVYAEARGHQSKLNFLPECRGRAFQWDKGHDHADCYASLCQANENP